MVVAVDVEHQVDEVEGVVVGAVVEACKNNPFISFLSSNLDCRTHSDLLCLWTLSCPVLPLSSMAVAC